MCGIIGYIGFQDPKGVLLDGLKRLEYRGYDSAGIAVLEPQGIELFRSEGRLQKLEKVLEGRHFRGSLGIGHTRWATHGVPNEINAHPHRVGGVTLVHNGIIENYLEHKAHILKLGRKMNSDTDSEIIAHLFDIELESGSTLEQATQKILPQLTGAYAFVLFSDKFPDLLLGVRNGAPLLAGVGKKETFIASDVQAILHRTNQILYFNDEEYVICRREGITRYRHNGEKLPVELKTLNWTVDQVDKAGYRHYMLKEIYEQPRAVTQTLEGNIDHGKGVVSISSLQNSLELLKGIQQIVIVACGTARHAALIGKTYFERYTQIPVEVDYGSEFRYRGPILRPKTLFVAISQSGETADTLAALREAKSKGIPCLTICNVRESTMTRESDVVIYTNAGPEIGVASTKAFTTQLTVLYMLAIQMGTIQGTLSNEEAKKLTQELLKLPTLIESILQKEKALEKIASDHEKNEFFFYMGRGLLYPIALEGALKLKEISYLHAEGYPAGELKHGPIALVDRKTAVIVLGPDEKEGNSVLFEKTMSNLQEVKSRGGQVFWIGSPQHEQHPTRKEVAFFFPIPLTTWALTPILVTIPLQIFAYHLAVLKGTDVDKPRNLAKSVTVE